MTDNINRIMKIIQEMPENNMTKDVIIPLLEHIGYKKVEFYGGTNEEGKDIIFWEKSKIGNDKLCVAQVKHFKFSNSASDSKGFQTVINQLIVCGEKKIINLNKQAYYPNEIFLVSTYPIDSKTLQTRFSENPGLSGRNIEIIDGPKLVSLLIENKQPIINKILGKQVNFTSYFANSINNKVLLKAIGFFEDVALKSIYTDIDFSFGKVTTEIFFSSNFKGTKKQYGIDSNEWSKFKEVIPVLIKYLDKTYVNSTINEIENKYKKDSKEYETWEKRLVDFDEKINFAEKVQKKKNQKGILKLKEERIILENNKPVLSYKFEFDGLTLSKQINDKRRYIEKQIKIFNKTIPNQNILKGFIQECKIIIDSSSKILSNKTIYNNLFSHTNLKISHRKDLEKTRLEISIDKIFNTEHNIILLGEAGAGKTTCLQMYALNNETEKGKLFVWAPLANIINNWKNKEAIIDKDNTYKIENFDKAIFMYLISKQISLSISEFINVFNAKKSTFLFDGIDEAIKNNPWLPKAVVRFSNKYNKSQIIITSRISGRFIDEIPFFTITLLPFTDNQRNEFITKWFSGKSQNTEKVVKHHLKNNKSISDITRNPLLITTLCVIANHNLPLPQSEVKLYNERLRLLTGYYDNVKNIDARISTTPQNLELLSQKLAFYLHNKATREAYKKELENVSVELMIDNMNSESAINALNELIDPCNILVPMSTDGKYGFGHLRYQEHLTAIELKMNRNIDIERLLTIEWWLDTLILFAHMSESIEWLISKIHYQITIEKIRNTINAMIIVRPISEQKEIIRIIKLSEIEAQELSEIEAYEN